MKVGEEASQVLPAHFTNDETEAPIVCQPISLQLRSTSQMPASSVWQKLTVFVKNSGSAF